MSVGFCRARLESRIDLVLNDLISQFPSTLLLLWEKSNFAVYLYDIASSCAGLYICFSGFRWRSAESGLPVFIMENINEQTWKQTKTFSNYSGILLSELLKAAPSNDGKSKHI